MLKLPSAKDHKGVLRKFGYKPDLPDYRDSRLFMHSRLSAPMNLPPKIDLRPFMLQVVDQMSVGACTGFALAAMREFLEVKEALGFGKDKGSVPMDKVSQADIDKAKKMVSKYSPLFIYYWERFLDGAVNVDSGAYIRDGMKVLQKWGACKEELWPYDVKKWATKPPVSAVKDGEQNQVIKYYRVNVNLSEIKSALASYLPIAGGWTLYEGFMSKEAANTGIVRMPDYREGKLGGHAMCFTKDTKVSLLDGTERTFSELTENFSDKSFWVYSCSQDGDIVPGLAHSPRKTGIQQPIITIKLDNGEVINCTPNHLFLLRTGEYKEAQQLTLSDSLMPLYRRKSVNKEMNGYEQVFNNKTRKWRFTHRLIYQEINGLWERGSVVHHHDYNKHNNSPDNLVVLPWDKHTVLHLLDSRLLVAYSKSLTGRERSRRVMQDLWADPAWRERALGRNRENGIKVSQKLKMEGRLGFQSPLPAEVEKSMRCKIGIKLKGRVRDKLLMAKICQSRKDRFLTDANYRKRVQTTAKNNLQKYTMDLKEGKVSLTEKQYNARKENVKQARRNPEVNKVSSLKTTFTRFYKHQFSSFEEFLLKWVPKKQVKPERLYYNHKIVDITVGGYADVYDLTVETYHNFALSSGIFVHNCLVGYDDNKALFTLKNSWGPKWGANGYAFLPYDYVLSLGQDFWTCSIWE